LNTLDEFLTNPPLAVQGNELVATILLPPLNEASMELNALTVGLMIPYFQLRGVGPAAPGPGFPEPKPIEIPGKPNPKLEPKVIDLDPKPVPKPDPKDDAARKQSLGSLRQLGLAMHTAHDTNGQLPAAAITDEDGKPLLSWRVAILPFIEEGALYKEFKLDEPWDSEHNKKLIARMPKLYANPRTPAPPGMTSYKVFVGADKGLAAAFDPKFKGRRFAEFTDGLSNTVLVVESGPPVEWTRPQDITFTSAKVPELAVPGQEDICMLMGDGRTVSVKWNKLPENVRTALITSNGGEVLPNDWDR
jgi:hypothetical protein